MFSVFQPTLKDGQCPIRSRMTLRFDRYGKYLQKLMEGLTYNGCKFLVDYPEVNQVNN